MAEINTAAGPGRKKGLLRRCKKLSTKVDLTPMVDLGFLLITFFVFTTSMSKSKTMDLILPAGEIESTAWGESTVLTIIPVSGDKIFYYHGNLNDAINRHFYGVTNFSLHNGIGDIIRAKQIALDKSGKFTRKDLLLIIKPTHNANYQNLVDALDEVLINDLKHYSLVDLTKAETDQLQLLGIN